jgi:hypothetical protein
MLVLIQTSLVSNPVAEYSALAVVFVTFSILLHWVIKRLSSTLDQLPERVGDQLARPLERLTNRIDAQILVQTLSIRTALQDSPMSESEKAAMVSTLQSIERRLSVTPDAT